MLINRPLRTIGLSVVCAVVVWEIPRADAASFTPLGDLPGGDFFSRARDVSADGSVIVGESRSGFPGATSANLTEGHEAFRWTKIEGMTGLGFLEDGHVASIANAVSRDGTYIVGNTRNRNSGSSGITGYRWDQANGMMALGGTSRAAAISADGSIISGWTGSVGGPSAFRWTESGLFDTSITGRSSVATGLSADGTTVFGVWGDFADGVGGFRLFQRTAGDRLILHDTVDTSVALGALYEGSTIVDNSSDGKIIVVSEHRQAGPAPGEFVISEPYRWTPEEGFVSLGQLDGQTFSDASIAVSGDGSIIVGSSHHHAFIWNTDDGMRDFTDVLATDFGVDLDGWVLTAATGISDNGLTIVGNGINPNGFEEAWIAIIPEPTTAWLLIYTVAGSLTGTRWIRNDGLRS